MQIEIKTNKRVFVVFASVKLALSYIKQARCN